MQNMYKTWNFLEDSRVQYYRLHKTQIYESLRNNSQIQVSHTDGGF